MKKVFKSKAFKIIAGLVVLFVVYFIAFGVGESFSKTEINNQKVSYFELTSKVDSVKEKLKKENDQVAEAQTTIAQGEKAKKELKDTEAKLKDKQAELDKELADGRKDIDAKLADANKGLADKQKDIDAKLADANKQLSDTQAKVTSIQGQVDAKQNELDSLTGQIVKAKGAPKILGAGQYVVGKDIPSGRYKAHAIGSGSNFFVYDADTGRAKVNTILGNASGIGSGDYTFFCSDNDIIETHESVQLTPVQ